MQHSCQHPMPDTLLYSRWSALTRHPLHLAGSARCTFLTDYQVKSGCYIHMLHCSARKRPMLYSVGSASNAVNLA